METVPVSELTPTQSLDCDLYDAVTGHKLIGQGSPLTFKGIRALVDCGIRQAYSLMPGESREAILRATQYREIDVFRIKPGTVLAFDVYGPTGGLLLAKGTQLTQAVIKRVGRHGVKQLYVRKSIDPEQAARVKRARQALQSDRDKAEAPSIVFSPAELILNPATLNPGGMDRELSLLASQKKLEIAPDPTKSLSRMVQAVDSLQPRAEKAKLEYTQLFQGLVEQTDDIFRHLRVSENMNGNAIHQMTQQVVTALINDRELLLASLHFCETVPDYLAQHAVSVAVVSVNIATAFGYSPKQVTEIGYGALLADIGMLSVADAIRFKEDALTSSERLEVMRHTLYGVERLQLIKNLPRSTPFMAYQSHERLDGSGYPHQKSAHAIHDYAKILSVADVYHAQISKRPFRPDGILPYRAVEEVLKMASKKQLDSRFARAFLESLSLFPVGSWVRLNTGECAQVLGANKGLYTRPVVAILYDARGEAVAPRRVDLLDHDSLKVVSPARMDGVDPLVGF